MTSKFASRIVCSPNPNRSELEYGGVSVKGGCGKIRWDNVKQGDKWVNAFYPEDEPLSSNCSASGANIEPSSDYHINEHSEVDWLSKVIAHQDHIYNDRSNNWSDMNHGKADLTKEEHDMDIISTLTAVAALLRDWCVLETDLSPMGADKHADKPTTVDTVYCNEWVWSKDDMDWQNNVSSMKKDALIQSEIFSMSHHDVAWGTFIQRHLEAQKMLYPSLFWSGSVAKIESGKMFPSDLADTKHDSFGFTKHTNHSWNSDGMAKKGLLFKPSYNRLNQLHIMRAEKEFQEAVTTSDSVEHDHTLLDIGSHIPCTHGPLHHTASRYNFGCEDDFRFDSDLGQLASVSADASELPEDCLMYGKGCRFMEVDINDHLSGLQYRELHDGGFNTPAISEHLVSTYGATDDVELDKKVNAIALVHEAMPFVFSYLSLQDLLTMEKVCKSFKDWIRNDVLLWQNLHIEPPLSKNLTDDVFIKLTSRCRGQLRCLNVVECTKLTEGAVEQVVLSNPRITKVCLFLCLCFLFLLDAYGDNLLRLCITEYLALLLFFNNLKFLKFREL
ncbi:hypothetical protein KP509_18G029100 [Ceratopteris richardii]|uniref:F-box domain-containing protein n=1 Tax=Ceratopteris richardii TaxID=49495 RepID=A0A8T2SPY9_CERRI|nr:hypothetical protein KP509_18G029100 [Ceratopteris richardii]